MPAQTRVGDIGTGTCPFHDTSTPYVTVFSTGSSTVSSDNLPNCTVTTIGLSTCGHPTVAMVGSPTIFHENLAAHRIGDIGMNYGLYVAVTGSPTVTCDDGTDVSGQPSPPSNPAGTPVGFQPTATPTQIIQSLNEDTPDVPYTTPQRNYMIDNGINPDQPTPTTQSAPDPAPLPTINPVVVICTNLQQPSISTKLSTNYTLQDVTKCAVSVATLTAINHATYGSLSSSQVLCNLQQLCVNVLEPIRIKYGSSMVITSALRNGTGKSQHLAGMAVDIQFPTEFSRASYTSGTYMSRVYELIALVSFDQFILEYGGTGPIFHLSFNSAGNRPTGTAFKLATRPSINNGPGSFLDGLHYLPAT